MLVILGNGFDLQCKLKTDYLDFFEKRHSKDIMLDFAEVLEREIISVNSIYRFYNKYQKKVFKEITIWDMVFLKEKISNRNPGWNNIENVIRDYVVNNKLTLVYGNKSANENIPSKMDSLMDIIMALLDLSSLKFSQIKYYDWLLDQLKIIERSFSVYIKSELESNYSYDSNAQILLYELIKKSNEKISILSFNYTNPVLIDNSGVTIRNVANVHGTIKDDIIFGIDEKDIKGKKYIEPNELKYMFTKTSRKLINYKIDSKFNLDKKESEILIYGHSLNDQDYSYFQSIFDFYNIYSSDVKVIFSFTNYNKARKIKNETVDGAIKLLKEYGSTMANKDNGSNLLHKLLLENRLVIDEIPGITDN